MNISFFFNQQHQQSQTLLCFERKSQQNLSIPQTFAQSKKKAKVNPFSWKSAESKKYIDFLKKNIHLMNLPVEERKRIRINVIMSQHIKSKDPEQCRSYHQKMALKYGSIQDIIDSHTVKAPRSRRTQCERRMDDFKVAQACQYKSYSTQEPKWHQYLTIFSEEKDRDNAPIEEQLF